MRNEWSIEVKDGDTVFWSHDSVKVTHADGTETVYYKSILHKIWVNLKSIAQRFRSRRKGPVNGGRTKRSHLKVLK